MSRASGEEKNHRVSSTSTADAGREVSGGKKWFPWVQAARPATLWAAVGPVAVGCGIALGRGCFALGPASAALLGAVFLQIGTNFANDLFDHRKGADGPDRLGPTRAVSAGWISPGAMAGATIAAFAVATFCGIYLTFVAGWWVVALGTASIAAGVLYTAGPMPLAYIGAGDLFVLLFFGFAAVVGTVAVQCGPFGTCDLCGAPPLQAWIAGLAVGLLNVAILVVNNLRDRTGDTRSNKRTLVVRFGPAFGRGEYLAVVAIAYACALALAMLTRSLAPLLPWLTLPMALACWRGVRQLDGAALNPMLGKTARLVLVFSLLLAVGLALQGTGG